MGVNETRPVRPGEELPAERLASYLRDHVPDYPGGAVQIAQFSAGHSNLTYLLQCGDWEAVLRRPPHGPVPPKAHDMAREHRWLQAVHPVFPLAPKPYVYCDQPEVLGAPFFVMERRSGIVVDRSWPDAYPETPEAARALAEALIDTLVALHAVDYSATAVVDMVRPEGYLERQVTGLVQRYQRAQTHDNPLALKVGQWMVNHLPKSPTPTLIHNDLKLNNMLFAPTDPGRPVAVLDWEMSTVGDPLSDFAILLSYWCEPDDPPLFRQLISPLTTRPGFPNRDALIQTYACKSGRDVSQMRYYMVFGYFKAAVICQQIFYRYAKGQTDDERFSQLGAAADGLVERAFALL